MCSDHVAAVAPADAHGMPPSDWPSAITLNQGTHTLELVWDGRPATLSHRVLRRSCRCSACESVRRKSNQVLDVDSEVTLLRIEPVGATALQLFFSDGHDRGIYPWTYLKQIVFGPTTGGFSESLMKGWRDE